MYEEQADRFVRALPLPLPASQRTNKVHAGVRALVGDVVSRANIKWINVKEQDLGEVPARFGAQLSFDQFRARLTSPSGGMAFLSAVPTAAKMVQWEQWFQEALQVEVAAAYHAYMLSLAALAAVQHEAKRHAQTKRSQPPRPQLQPQSQLKHSPTMAASAHHMQSPPVRAQKRPVDDGGGLDYAAATDDGTMTVSVSSLRDTVNRLADAKAIPTVVVDYVNFLERENAVLRRRLNAHESSQPTLSPGGKRPRVVSCSPAAQQAATSRTLVTTRAQNMLLGGGGGGGGGGGAKGGAGYGRGAVVKAAPSQQQRERARINRERALRLRAQRQKAAREKQTLRADRPEQVALLRAAADAFAPSL